MLAYNAAGDPVRSNENPRVWSPFRGHMVPDANEDRRSRATGQEERASPLTPIETAGEGGWHDDQRLFRDYLFCDETVRLYGIGALAAATGKKASTIRKWIETRVILDSGFRTPGIRGTLGDAGRRLWTGEQIDAIVKIGSDEGVVGVRRPRRMSDTNFPERLRTLWIQNNW
ncbi:MAG TPA: hypothetical protein VFZ97_06655 [Acidimicrobiales bacterium]